MYYTNACRYGIRCNAILPGFIATGMTATVPDKIIQTVSLLEVLSCAIDRAPSVGCKVNIAGTHGQTRR